MLEPTGTHAGGFAPDKTVSQIYRAVRQWGLFSGAVRRSWRDRPRVLQVRLFPRGMLVLDAYERRACAVFGGTYVLGKESILESMEIEHEAEYPVKLKIPCHPRTINAKHLVSSPDHVPPHLRRSAAGNVRRATAHCIALLPALPTQLKRFQKDNSDGVDGDEDEEGQDDTAIIVFPPSGDQGLVRALIMGEGTGSCPAGQCTSFPSYNRKWLITASRSVSYHRGRPSLGPT